MTAYEKMIADREAAKAASRARSRERKAASNAHKAEVAAHAATQVGPFVCLCCKTAEVEKYGVICAACDKQNKEQGEAWYAAKSRITGTF